MSWLRHDDMRSLNRKIGQLGDAEYRALDALMEFVSRSKMDGTFDQHEIKLAAYLTPNGPKRVTQRQLNRYLELGLVDDNTDPANPHQYKIHDWDTYNPKDPTAAERMRNYRRNQDRNADRNENVTHARASRPVPNNGSTEGSSVSNKSQSQEPSTTSRARETLTTLDFGAALPFPPAGPHD